MAASTRPGATSSWRRWAVLAGAAAVVGLASVAVLEGLAGAGAERASSVVPIGQVVGSITAGSAHTCGVQTSRVVRCWGKNDLGQATAPAGTFADVSAGGSFTCGIKTDATLACWGKNDVGQATPPVGTFRQLTTGDAHACAVMTDGSGHCWGSNTLLQSAPPGYTYREMTAGDRHTCGLRSDGLVVCWGDDSLGQTESLSSFGVSFVQISAGANHTCGVEGNGTVGCWGANGSGQSTPPAGTFREVSSGTAHTCGLAADGTIACWGSNANGQTTAPAGTFTAVTAGASHSCGIRTDGSEVCWGLNTDGQATAHAGVFNSRALDAGFFNTCGIRTDGVAVCWGDNSFGQSSAPSGTFWQISAGLGFSCGIKSDGTLACWGSGYPGSPPQPPPAGTFKQVRVSAAGGVGGHPFACALRTSGAVACWGDPAAPLTPPASQFFELGVGQTHACAVMTGGGVSCWGDNAQGQTTSPTGAYLQVAGEDYTNLSAFTSCALRVDGNIICWGDNSSGQASPPTGPYTQFDLGSWFGCAVRGDGTAACWGKNDSGESTPPAGGFLGVTTGDSFACGTRVNGNVVCWGNNTSGQRGGKGPHFTSAEPPGAVFGQAYTHAYSASGLAKNSFKVTSGALPPGLALDSLTGALSGTATKTGTFTGTVTVSNGFFGPDESQSFSITVLPVRTVAIADRDVREGDSGSVALGFPVTISAPVPAGQTSSVSVATQDLSATAGSDYTAVSTTLTWNPGDALTKTVNMTIAGDTRKEGPETFRVRLTSPTNLVIADASAIGAILDDDGSFYLSVNDTAVTEGNSGTVFAQFSVTLSAAPATGQTVTVQIATADGTASAASDYTALATTLTWIPGDPLTKLVKVAVNGDITVEPSETFTLVLSSPTGFTTLSDSQGIATITNDD